ncbi:hypothetical protein D0469_02030 [Peribacillus saganii]|uniref:RNA polymerase subunit sigma n=1 Tax=Peribacillus saganii TaxID=2303992 RepID=A0A372LSZ8_9BACI|nr:hypothetical protein [Peribacillus saganii]RFU71313.1 hypothetical protein D0469_02030 [Peribacillus saganii]
MSLKSIEMQVALPRTYDASKLQEQLQQRGQLMHDNAAREMHKEDKKKRTTVMKQKAKERPGFPNEDQSNGSYSGDQSRKQKKNIKEKNHNHPYKGNNIDFSG